MQYIEKTKGTPYKMERHPIPSIFEWMPNGDLKVTETIKRDVYFKKEEAIKAKNQIDNKLGFHKYELSEEYKEIVQRDINTLQQASDEWTEALNKLKKQEQPAGDETK